MIKLSDDQIGLIIKSSMEKRLCCPCFSGKRQEKDITVELFEQLITGLPAGSNRWAIG